VIRAQVAEDERKDRDRAEASLLVRSPKLRPCVWIIARSTSI